MANSPSSGTAAPRPGLGELMWRWTKRLLILGLLGAVAGAVALWQVLQHYEHDLPSTADLRDYRPPQVTRVLARDGSTLAELFIERRTVVAIGDIPKVMKVAVLAAEDADFYQHEGLDYLGMLRALVVNLRHGHMKQGGSTITQQVIKNVLLTHERTFARKAREVLLARRIEQELSKDEILELYLNHIYFGHGRYGVEEAARYYFGKGVAELTLAEAALIAGLPKGPSIYSPRVSFERAKQRRDLVLDQIGAKGFANPSTVQRAKAEPIALAPAVEALPELAPEVVSEVRRFLRELVGPTASRGGFIVTTTIDPQMQAAARKAVRDNLDDYAERHLLLAPFGEPADKGKKGKKSTRQKKKSEPQRPFQGTPQASGHHVYRAVVTGADDDADLLKVRVGTVDGTVRLASAARYNPKRLPPSKVAERGTVVRVSPVLERGVGSDGVPREFRLELGPQGALVAVDVASREIRALVGSYEAVRGGLDRASQARRQPGSTFKPVVYSYGIHSRRITPATIVALEPDSEQAKPAKDGDRPPLLVRDALARSVNEAAVWALHEVGSESVVSWAAALGIESPMKPTDSLALGAYEVKPRELAATYTTFASGGTYEKPSLISRVVGPDGADIALPKSPPRRRVLEQDEAFVVTSLLTSVIRSGTGRRARALGLPLAGKTGTSNEAKDAWFAGYSPELVCVVWTGYDDAQPLGRGESGASAALPAWMAFMKAAHAGHSVKPFQRPEGIVEVAIDPATGLLPYPEQEGTRLEIFLAGTEPTEQAEAPDAGSDAGVDGGGDDEEPDGGVTEEGDGAGVETAPELVVDDASQAGPDGAPPASEVVRAPPPPASTTPPPF